jgi:hypothetical protein
MAKKKAKAAKKKGSGTWKAYERHCARWLSQWLAGKLGSDLAEHNRIVCRQALYGRMIEKIHGDLAIHPDCDKRYLPAAQWFMNNFQVDAKHRKEFTLTSLLNAPRHRFYEWWKKLAEDAAAAGQKKRLMILMDHHSRMSVAVFGFFERKWLTDVVNGLKQAPFASFTLRPAASVCEEEITLCEFESFLHWLDPHMLGCPAAVEESGGTNDAGPVAEARPQEHPLA